MHHEREPERRRTRTLSIGPVLKGIVIAGATSAVLSAPLMTWHALKTMWAVQAMRQDYNTIMRQNVALQIQTHRLTDAVNDLRRPLGLPPLDAAPLVGQPEFTGASARSGRVGTPPTESAIAAIRPFIQWLPERRP